MNFDVLILEMKFEDFEINEDGNDKEEIKDGLLKFIFNCIIFNLY